MLDALRTPSGTAHPQDIGHLLDTGEWTLVQKLITFLTAVAVVIDGFDNQILGFAIPAIIKDWGVTRAQFSPVVAIGLIGMSAGAALAGPLGDRLGRRVAMLWCVILFGLATLAIYFCNGMTALAVLRFLSSAGVGGALPNAAALTSEFTPLARRAMAVTFTIVCVPLGGMLAGFVGASVLPVYGWRMLFAVGGIAPLLLAGILAWLLPESPRFLARHAERWSELRGLLARIGRPVHESAAFFDPVEQKVQEKNVWKTLFGPELRRDTQSLWLMFFCSTIGIYIVFSWLPAMLSASGFSLAEASSGLAWFNMGGVAGALLCGYLAANFGSRVPTLACAALAAVSAFALIYAGGDHQVIIYGLGINGFFVNAVQTTGYALAAHVYPTRVRATGVAWALTIGRGASVGSAFLGAWLVQTGLPAYLTCMGVLFVGAFLGLALVRNHIPGASRA